MLRICKVEHDYRARHSAMFRADNSLHESFPLLALRYARIRARRAGPWRIGGGRANSTLKPAGLVIGATILTVIALSWLGVVSLDGVEACLNEKSGGRGKLIWYLGYVRKAMP